MPNLERKLPKLAAIAAPALVWLSAEACTNSQPKETYSATPITRTPEGAVNPAFSNPTTGSTIEIIEPTPEPADNTVTFVSGSTEYELYTGITVDDMIQTSNTLPDSPAKESIINNIQGVQTALRINPQDSTVVLTLNQVINMVDANCKGEESKELTKEIASYVHENHPDQYEGTRKLAEQGPCSVLSEDLVEKPTNTNLTNLEPVIGLYNQEIHTAFRGNYAYTYDLPPVPDLSIGIQGLGALMNNPDLFGYIQNNDERSKVLSLYDEALSLSKTNPQNAEIANKIYGASMIIKNHCDNGFNRVLMRGNLSVIRSVDPEFFKEKQFEFIDSGCFESVRFEISPEFKIKPLLDGTFIYEDVTYEDVIQYAQNLETVYDPSAGNFQRILNWIEHARANQGDIAEEALGWNSATNLIVGACERSDLAVNTLRLAESVVAQSYPGSAFANTSHSRHRSCFAYFMGDDQYFSNR